MPKHVFTQEETVKGVMASKLSRRGIARTMKKITGMEIEGETIGKVIDLLKTVAASPIGQIVVSWFIIDLAQKTHYIDYNEAIALKALITSAEVIGSIGGAIGQAGGIGGIIGALK